MRKGIYISLFLLAIGSILLVALGLSERTGDAFTPEQRAFLISDQPRGRFITQYTFRTCQDGYFAYFYSDEAFVVTLERCWTHQLPPPLPSFLPTRP